MRVHALLAIVLAVQLPNVLAQVIQRIYGANLSEVGFASSGGGTHLYIVGSGIGSAFAPPSVFVGINADAECVVQPFTSTRNRLHCIVSAEGLPPPNVHYSLSPRFYSHPIRVLKNGRLAQCWHVGGINHGCSLRYDLAGAPRVHRVVTSVLQSAGVVRLQGQGIDGGLNGQPGMIATLYRGQGQLVVGACGEKDCAPSNMGMQTIGCLSRLTSGDGVLGQENAAALVHSDKNNFGCKLDALAGGLTGGFFNLSLHAMDSLRRGDAYLGFSTTRKVDLVTGNPFYVEMLPVITGIEPRKASLAGGADLTIYGTGFGSEYNNLAITVGNGSATCHVTTVSPSALHCRVAPLQASSNKWTEPPPMNADAQARLQQSLTSYPSQRGVRFQWRDDGLGTEHSHGASGTMLLDDFSAPLDYEAGKAGSKAYVEGWFEAPMDMDATFFLRIDPGAGGTLHWSGNETVSPVELLATTPSYSTDGLTRENYADPAVPPVLVEIWKRPPAFECAAAATGSYSGFPCAEEMAAWPSANDRYITTKVSATFKTQNNFLNLAYGEAWEPMAARWSGQFQALKAGEMAFKLHATGAATLLIDGVEIAYGASSNPTEGRVSVLAIQWYSFEVQTYEATGGNDYLRLEYMYPGARCSFCRVSEMQYGHLNLDHDPHANRSILSARITLLLYRRYGVA